MTSVVIAGCGSRVGIVDEVTAVLRDGYVLNHEPAGSQQRWFAAGRRYGVQVGPVIHFGEECDAVARGPAQVDIAAFLRKRAPQGVRALPDLIAIVALRVSYPDGPGNRIPLENRLRRAPVARRTCESDPRAI